MPSGTSKGERRLQYMCHQPHPVDRELPPADPGGEEGLDGTDGIRPDFGYLGNTNASELAGPSDVYAGELADHLPTDPCPAVYLVCVALFTVTIILGLRLARQYLWIRRNNRHADDASAKHEHRRHGASSSLRPSAFTHPFVGPTSIHFASEAQPLLTSSNGESGLGHRAETWADEELCAVAASLSDQTRRVRFASDPDTLAAIHSDSSSLAQHGDHSTSAEQQGDEPEDTKSDTSDSSGGDDRAPESSVHLQENFSSLCGSPAASTEVDSARSRAVYVTSSSDEARSITESHYGSPLLRDSEVGTTANEVDDALSDPCSFVGASGDGSLVSASAGSVSGMILFHGGNINRSFNEVDDDVLSDAHFVNESDGSLSDAHLVNEMDGVLSETTSIGGFSETSSWITMDAESNCDYPYLDAESDSDAWVTTDESGSGNSDLDSPASSNEGQVPSGFDSHPLVANSLDSIPSDDSGSSLRSFTLSSRANSRLEQLDSPALSELAEDISARLLGYADSDSLVDVDPRRMPLSVTSSSINGSSNRGWTPAASGFVFSVGAPVPSTSSPAPSTSRLVPVHHLRDPQDERALATSSTSSAFLEEGSGLRGPFMRQSVEAAQPQSSPSAFLDRLARLAQGCPEEHIVGTVALREKASGALFSSHRRLVTV